MGITIGESSEGNIVVINHVPKGKLIKSNPSIGLILHSLIALYLSSQLVSGQREYYDRPLTSIQFHVHNPDSPEKYIASNRRTIEEEDDLSNSLTDTDSLATGRTPPLDTVDLLRRFKTGQAQNEQQTASFNRRPEANDVYLHNMYAISDNGYNYDSGKILPERVHIEPYADNGSGGDLFSPIFNYQLVNPSLLAYGLEDSYDESYTNNNENNPNAQQISSNNLPQNKFTDTSNSFDLIEPGSGDGWNGIRDETPNNNNNNNILEDSTTAFDLASPIMPSPTLTTNMDQLATPAMDINFNRAPVLNRRLPKLSITAGQVWKYFIPVDTFLDEDGDLRQLNSTIVFRTPTIESSNKISAASNNGETTNQQPISEHQYYSWLQYDSFSQLLYGLPTEDDVGYHKLALVVSDRWGAMSEELIEINVNQHQSIRAFTHLFTINGIRCEKQRYPSVVDAIGEFIRRVSVRVFSDEPFRNLIIHFYRTSDDHKTSSVSNRTSSGDTEEPMTNDGSNLNMSFTIGWSNSSIPVHPCNTSQVEDLARLLIDSQPLTSRLSLERGDKIELPPSQNLISALSPEFRPSTVSFSLQGSCEGKLNVSVQNNLDSASDVTPRVKIKIGKLTWKLGEPIEYKIPAEIFSNEKGTLTTRQLQLSLHTIDGMILDKDPRYRFLEFNQEEQTLYGLSYNREDHAGQRELQLTARHPKSGLKTREVFIINIEPQDLTTINNRAFKMSLYFMTRTGIFSPRDRIALSHKIVNALGDNDREFLHDSGNSNMIVIDVPKFAIEGIDIKNSAISRDGLEFNDKITRIMDDIQDQTDELIATKDGRRDILYKFSWTNATIGFRGDCPVEVIKENILNSLERSMSELRLSESYLIEEMSKNDSVRFYERLSHYFGPQLDLIHLRFEPLNACTSVLELHDVGNSDIADLADKTTDIVMHPYEIERVVSAPASSPAPPKVDPEPTNEEYWTIFVLIVLVLALIFVIIMFFLGIHTYKINQDKRFELQIKLAQARQNSMYLSSMILANQASAGMQGNEFCGPMWAPGMTKSMHVVRQEEDKGSRKPVILDNEKRLLTGNQPIGPVDLKSTAVQLTGQTVHTMPMKPNMTFTLDSMANCAGNWQPAMSQSPSRMMQNYMDDKRRSMTLNHRNSSTSMQRFAPRFQPAMNHSQSILTVASMTGHLPIIARAPLPVVYAQLPLNTGPRPQNYSSLQRSYSRQGDAEMSMPQRVAQAQQRPSNYGLSNVIEDTQTTNNIKPAYPGSKVNPVPNGNVAHLRNRSPSYSSSASAATHSVVSNPNYTAN